MITSDAVVVGGGIAGTSIAFELSKHMKVILLEAEDVPGYHSTGRSAALLLRVYGSNVIQALTRASADFFENPPEGMFEHNLISDRSILWIAANEQKKRFDDLVQEYNSASVALESMDCGHSNGVCTVLSDQYKRSNMLALDCTSKDIDVHALHQGFLRAFKMRGGEVKTRAIVHAITNRSSTWVTHSRRNSYESKYLINAAGAWCDDIAKLAGVAPLNLIPTRRTAITFNPNLHFDYQDFPLVVDVDEQFYFKPESGLMLASPADETPAPPCDAQPEEMDIAVAVHRIEQATTMRVKKIASKWAGLRTFAPDRNPIVGFDTNASGFFWFGGQGGAGIMVAPGLARAGSQLILDGSLPTDIESYCISSHELSPSRFDGQSCKKRVSNEAR